MDDVPATASGTTWYVCDFDWIRRSGDGFELRLKIAVKRELPLDRLDHGVRLSDSRWFFRADASGRISVRTVTGFSDRFHLFGLRLVGYCNLAHRVLGVCQWGSVVAAAGLVLWSLTRHRFWFDVALGLGLDLTSDIGELALTMFKIALALAAFSAVPRDGW